MRYALFINFNKKIFGGIEIIVTFVETLELQPINRISQID